jgi:hypothetical protein
MTRILCVSVILLVDFKKKAFLSNFLANRTKVRVCVRVLITRENAGLSAKLTMGQATRTEGSQLPNKSNIRSTGIQTWIHIRRHRTGI